MKKGILIITINTLFFSITSCSPILILIAKKSIEDTEGKENIKSKYNDDNLIFKTNKEFNYKTFRIDNNDTLPAKIYSSNDTILVDKVQLKILPGKFFHQTKIKWKYFYNNILVSDGGITGLEENSAKIWFHPPRINGTFIYTECCAFPITYLPMKEGSTWSELTRTGPNSYKEIGLQNSTINNTFKILKKEIFNGISDCWKIETSSKSVIGNSSCQYYFHEQLGFVYIEYTFPKQDKLIMQLQ